MKNIACEKIVLASGLGLRLLYCKNCAVVELEIGAVSMRLSPDAVQRMANLMMKASLNLDQITRLEKQFNQEKLTQLEKTPANWALH